MINTITPYGAIGERECSFLAISPDKHQLFVVDKNGNQWEIGLFEFNKLKDKGFEVKEVKIR
jgi:6-phosphogluconolactonase (cycloisomerase 2 family)